MKKIVLTGGPCAGKTTAKNYLFEKLSDIGYSVIFVPEVATEIIGAGLNPRDLSKEQIFQFQDLILKTQLRFEDDVFLTAMNIKQSGEDKKIMICDRGCMDGSAYMAREDFDHLLTKNKLDRVMVRDKRYDAIFHLVTAAEGREEFYTLANNAARLENAEEARDADKRTRSAWVGHPHLRVIDNSTLFDEKLKRLLNHVRKFLGIPVAIETERKFALTEPVDLHKIPVPYQKITIEQFYLKSSAPGSLRLRRRSQDSCGAVYYETIKQPTDSAMSRVETEYQIDYKEYYRRLADMDMDTRPIHKTRVCFLWQGQYFELDLFHEPDRVRGLQLLEIELTEENDKVEIPEWLGKVVEVTGQKRYSNFNISKAF